jgi:hypothetical protein
MRGSGLGFWSAKYFFIFEIFLLKGEGRPEVKYCVSPARLETSGFPEEVENGLGHTRKQVLWGQAEAL